MQISFFDLKKFRSASNEDANKFFFYLKKLRYAPNEDANQFFWFKKIW